MRSANTLTRPLVALLITLATGILPAFAARPYDPSIQGSFAIGHCLDATHQEMGVGKYVQAPDYFNPLTASDAELACYGFPSRPTKATDLARWHTFMTQTLADHAQYWVHAPSRTLPYRSDALARPLSIRPAYWNGPITGGTGFSADIWSGYEPSPGSADNNQPFDAAFSDYVVPAPLTPYADHTDTLSQWVGLGCCQAASNYLLQTGTDVFVSSSGTLSSQFW